MNDIPEFASRRRHMVDPFDLPHAPMHMPKQTLEREETAVQRLKLFLRSPFRRRRAYRNAEVS